MASELSQQAALNAPTTYIECRKAGKQALIFVDHDLTTSCTDPACSCHDQPWIVCAARGYLIAARAHGRIGNLVVPHSARGFDALKEGLPTRKIIIYNNGMGIYDNTVIAIKPQHQYFGGHLPDWTNTLQRLSPRLTDSQKTKLVAQGYSFYFYVNETHPDYQRGFTAIEEECARLNREAGKDLWRCGSYPNGHIIEPFNTVGKKQGIINFLDHFCREYGVKDHKELFEKHIGFVGFADDSPSAYNALEYVKSLPVGYSWQVLRPGATAPADHPHCNEIVRDADHMVAILKAMADYDPPEPAA